MMSGGRRVSDRCFHACGSDVRCGETRRCTVCGRHSSSASINEAGRAAALNSIHQCLTPTRVPQQQRQRPPLTRLDRGQQPREFASHAATMLLGGLRAALAAHSVGTAASGPCLAGAVHGAARAYHVARLASRGVISVTGADCLAFLQVRAQGGQHCWLCSGAHSHSAAGVHAGHDHQRPAPAGAAR